MASRAKTKRSTSLSRKTAAAWKTPAVHARCLEAAKAATMPTYAADDAMKSDEAIIQFAEVSGASLDWLIRGIGTCRRPTKTTAEGHTPDATTTLSDDARRRLQKAANKCIHALHILRIVTYHVDISENDPALAHPDSEIGRRRQRVKLDRSEILVGAQDLCDEAAALIMDVTNPESRSEP